MVIFEKVVERYDIDCFCYEQFSRNNCYCVCHELNCSHKEAINSLKEYWGWDE